MGQLTDTLLGVHDADIGFAPDVAGHAFAPIPSVRKCLRGNSWYELSCNPSEIMKEIVSCGATAIPELLLHLDDMRATKCSVPLVGFVYLVNHLDFLEFDIVSALSNGGAAQEWTGGPGYDVTVGDLCYVALGQIVNRNYCSLYYQPSRITIVNSPVLLPEVARRARELWGPADRRTVYQSLCADLRSLAVVDRRESSATRLLFYYADKGVDSVVEELFRETYSVYRVGKFYKSIEQLATGSVREEEVRDRLDGSDLATISGILDDLPRRRRFWPQFEKRWELIHREVTNRLGSLRGEAVSLARQSQLIKAISPFEFVEIDKAVFGVLSSVAELPLPRESDEDALAFSCATRLLRSPRFRRSTLKTCNRIFTPESVYYDDYVRITTGV